MISQVLQHGWRRASLVALAPLLSDGPIIVAAILLLTRLSDWRLYVLQILGGAFILYLAMGAWRALREAWGHVSGPAPTPQRGQTLLRAATLNMLSPMVYIFWGTVSGPLLVQGWQRSPILGLGFVASFYGIMILASETIVLAVCWLKGLYAGVTRIMLALSFLLMLGIGVSQIWSGIASLGG